MDVLNLEETEALSVLNGLVEDDAMEFDAALEQIDELFGEIRGIAKKLSKYRNRNQRIETLRGNIDRHAGKLRTKGVLAYDDSKAKAQHATLDRIYHDSSLPRADYEKHSNIIKDQDGALGKRQNLINRAARWDKIGASMQAKDGKARPPKVRHLSGMREQDEDFDAELLVQFHEAADQIEVAVLDEGADLETIEGELYEGALTRKFVKWYNGSSRRDKLLAKLDDKRVANDAAYRYWRKAADETYDKHRAVRDKWDKEVFIPYHALANAGNRAAAEKVLPAGTRYPTDSMPVYDRRPGDQMVKRIDRGFDLRARIGTISNNRSAKKKHYLSGKVTESSLNEDIIVDNQSDPIVVSSVKQYALIGAQLNPERNKYAGTMINEAYADHTSVEEFIRAQIQAGFGRDQILGKMIAEGADGQMVQHVRRKIDAMYNKNNRS